MIELEEEPKKNDNLAPLVNEKEVVQLKGKGKDKNYNVPTHAFIQVCI